MQTWTVAVVDDEHKMLLMLTFIFMHCMIMTWHDTKLNSYIYYYYYYCTAGGIIILIEVNK